MRGPSAGALSRTYLHSGITEGLWCAVSEAELVFGARLAHAVMLSSLYGNPAAKLEEGNDQVHEMYLEALHTLPYIRVATASGTSHRNDELVAEWRRVNAEEAAKRAKENRDPESGGEEDAGV